MSNIRNTNLELYRILLMLSIVMHHFVVNSGLIPELNNDPLSGKSIFFYIVGMWGKTGINCFVLITGYFMCKSEITLRKFLKLILQVEFYNIAILLAFYFSGYYQPTFKQFFMALMPVKSVSDAFTSCFLVFYLFIPFLNILVRNLNQRQHQLLLLLSLSVYMVLADIIGSRVRYNYVTWFCILYFIASYYRFYGMPLLKHKYMGLVSILLVFASVASVLLVLYITKGSGDAYLFVNNPNFILPTITSVSLFVFFKDLNIPHSRIINTIASSTFGVLLIHANSDVMRQWLWYDVVDVVTLSNSHNYILLTFVSVLVIYAVCVIIDQIRIVFIEKPFFSILDKYMMHKSLS